MTECDIIVFNEIVVIRVLQGTLTKREREREGGERENIYPSDQFLPEAIISAVSSRRRAVFVSPSFVFRRYAACRGR